MNREFKLRFDQMKQGNPTLPEPPPEVPGEPDGGYRSPRSLELDWPDGRRFFLSYAYLIGGEFSGGEPNRITLYFTSYTVFVKGYGLASLMPALSSHEQPWLAVTEARYVSPEETDSPVVTDIRVEKAEG